MRVACRDFETDGEAMSRRVENWPRIYRRVYPTGRSKWLVDLGKQGGETRQRHSFDTRAEAEGFAQQARIARDNQGTVAFFLPYDAQAQAIKLYECLKAYDISLDDVRAHYLKDVIPYLAAPTVSEIAERLMKEVSSNNDRDHWPKKLRGFLDEFCRSFGARKITDITKEELAAL